MVARIDAAGTDSFVGVGTNGVAKSTSQAEQTARQPLEAISKEAKVQPEKEQKEQLTPNEKEKLVNMSKTMSDFIALADASLRFEIHESTQRVMVNLVNATDNRVLKSFPSKEFLDMVGSVGKYVGLLLDKKA